MHSSIFILVAAFGSVIATPAPQATGTNLALGAQCDPSIPNQCANGANCYATNSMLIPSCGNFQASCTTDSQCAFNTCNNGFCNGIKPSSTASEPSGPSGPKPTGMNLPLGADCDPAVENQCANDADCYATNFMLQPRCGNFQASCSTDSQCAFNKCNGGFCSGPLLSTAYTTATPTNTARTMSIYTNSSITSSIPVTAPSSSATAPPTYVNTTTTREASTGYTTSIVIVDGTTSSVLINGAGATTSFASTPTGTLQSNGAAKAVAGGLMGLFAVSLGAAMAL